MVISGKIDDCFAHINGITTGSKVFHVDMQNWAMAEMVWWIIAITVTVSCFLFFAF
jgi:hypothetical protein